MSMEGFTKKKDHLYFYQIKNEYIQKSIVFGLTDNHYI